MSKKLCAYLSDNIPQKTASRYQTITRKADNGISKKENAYLPERWRICVLFFAVLEDGTHKQNCEVWPRSDKTRDSKGYPFATQPLGQRCSVLYLLLRLTGKMRVSHDGHSRFIRQESGQVFANGNEQKACSLSEVAAGI